MQVKLALYPKKLYPAAQGLTLVSRAHGFDERRSFVSRPKRETVAFVRRVCLLLSTEQFNDLPVQPFRQVVSHLGMHNDTYLRYIDI